LRQRDFKRCQRRAGTHRDHQLAGFVGDDAFQRGGVQHLALQTLPKDIFRAAAADAQRRGAGSRQVNGIDQGLERGIGHGPAW
jgi:hypothetical protein